MDLKAVGLIDRVPLLAERLIKHVHALDTFRVVRFRQRAKTFLVARLVKRTGLFRKQKLLEKHIRKTSHRFIQKPVGLAFLCVRVQALGVSVQKRSIVSRKVCAHRAEERVIVKMGLAIVTSAMLEIRRFHGNIFSENIVRQIKIPQRKRQIPFMTEDIYRNLVCSIDKNAPETIHLCDFPEVNEAMIDKALEASMGEVLDVVVLGRACRNSANIKNRQPIAKMYVKADLALADEYSEIIEDELNVKEVIYTDDVSAFTSYSFKPQLRTLGKKLGKNLGKLRELLPTIDGNAAMAELNATGLLKVDLGEVVAELTKEDLIISAAQMPGFESLSDHGVTVVLDTNLTPELIEEGHVREIISKIQTMRKDADFEVLDKIRVYVLANDAMRAVMEKNASDIMTKTLCTEFIFGETCDTSKEWSIGDEKMTIGVEKV